MNPLLRDAAASVELGWLLGALTAVFLVVFTWWTWYAYAPSHRARMEAAARLPFEEEDR